MPANAKAQIPDQYAGFHKTLADLTPDPRNANKGTERGQKMIADSLREYGAGRSILLDRNGRIIAGNKTAQNAGAAGLRDVIVVETDGTQLVAVQRMDLDLDDPRAKQMAIADNRAGQVSLDWDIDVLKELATEIDLAPFWSVDELEAMWPQNADLLTDEDAVPDLPEEAVTRPGDLYILGRHRLLCGDSTIPADVDKLLAGASPHLMVTDPTYGVDYDPKWRVESGVNKPWQKRAEGVVQNDNRCDWSDAWALFPGDCAYIWHSALHSSDVARSLIDNGFEIRSQLIWHKPSLVIGRGHYHWQHEPCWYVVKSGRTGHWQGDRTQSTIWDIPNMHRTQGEVDDGKTNHSTQKPVACHERPIVNNSRQGESVYDPFGGSGTGIIACEKTGRSCYMMELDPRYCDVIVQRWQDATGQKAVLDGAPV